MMDKQKQENAKQGQGICLLFLSAFLFSFMGMFLQFTGRMGIPSTELVFIRALFQGLFVIIGMLLFRVDGAHASMARDGVEPKEDTSGDDVEAGFGSEGVDLIDKVHGELAEEKKIDGDSVSREDQPLLSSKKDQKYQYSAISMVGQEQRPTCVSSSRIIMHPFGTTPTMRKVVVLRGIIGGFGFVNYYYTLSTLPLGDATTLLSLYPIVTIFLARVVLGEEIRPMHVAAALFSVAGATLISRPSFLFGYDGTVQHRPPALGYVTALVGSACASGVIVLIRKAGRVGAHTLQLLFSWVVFGVSFSLLIGFLAASSADSQQWRMPSLQEMPYVLGVCVSGTCAHFLLNYSAKLMPATLSGLIRSSDIGYAYLLEVVVLGQHPESETYWGVLLVCSSLALVLFADKASSKLKHLNSVGNLTAAK